jgi:hypothetical protein
MSLLPKIICYHDMAQFLKPAKLRLSLCMPFYEDNVFTIFMGEASALSSASSGIIRDPASEIEPYHLIFSMVPCLFGEGVS